MQVHRWYAYRSYLKTKHFHYYSCLYTGNTMYFNNLICYKGLYHVSCSTKERFNWNSFNILLHPLKNLFVFCMWSVVNLINVSYKCVNIKFIEHILCAFYEVERKQLMSMFNPLGSKRLLGNVHATCFHDPTLLSVASALSSRASRNF